MVKFPIQTPINPRAALASSRISARRGTIAKSAPFVTDVSIPDPSSSGFLNRGADLRGQVSGTLRQNPVTVAVTAPNTTASAPISPAADTSTTPKTDDAILQSLKDALAAAGINTSSLGLALHNTTETYPSGSYTNRYISVNTPRGSTGLMTDLVGQSPNVAVLDIKRMLGLA